MTCRAPETWQAFRRQVLDGMTAEQVAAQLDMPLHSVYAAKSRVLKALRGGAYCKLGGEDPSIDAAASDVCGGPDRLPRLLKLVRLTSRRRDTLQLEDRIDDCPGPVHISIERVAFLDAHGDRLVQAFQLKTREASSEAPEEPAQVLTPLIFGSPFSSLSAAWQAPPVG